MTGERSIGRMVSGLIIGVLLVAAGYVVAFYIGKPILAKARASTDWPSVTGVITHSEVITRRDNDGTTYAADVAYSYKVGRRTYRSGTVSFGGDFSSSMSSYAYGITNRYPVNRQVTVFYDPSSPGTAVLEAGTTWKSYMVFGIGLLFLVVGVLLCGSQLLYLGGGILILGGAAIGAFGRSRRSSEPHNRSGKTARSVAPPERQTVGIDSADDGIDIK